MMFVPNRDEPRPTRQRIIRIDREMLRSFLKLPNNVTIVAVSDELYFETGDIAIKIECPDFRPVPAGNHIQSIDPFYKAVWREVEFSHWSEELDKPEPPPAAATV